MSGRTAKKYLAPYSIIVIVTNDVKAMGMTTRSREAALSRRALRSFFLTATSHAPPA